MKSNPIVRPEAVFQNMKLSFKLMKDRRVSFLLKLVTIGAGFIYLISPDIMPGVLDDAGFIYLCTIVFVRLCPKDVVNEIMSQERDKD
jgi:uncharacterized membrane protein YkvA (DUF1232 family)